MKNGYVSMLVLAGLGVLSYLGLSTTASNAQTNTAPKDVATPLERKVEQLEKQVALLQKQVEELKQRPMLVTYTNPAGQAQRGEPPPGTAFEFNGRTYYHAPLKAGSGGTVNSGKATVERLAPAPERRRSAEVLWSETGSDDVAPNRIDGGSARNLIGGQDMAAQVSETDREQPGVTRRALLSAAGAVGLAAAVTRNAVADDETGVERTFEGKSEEGNLQAALDKALEQLDKALDEGGVRDATATWKVAAISGERGTFKEGRTVKVAITATRSPQWDKK